MNSKKNIFSSTALATNLERTRAVVQIPEKHRVLFEIAKEQYGILKRVDELLTELNHPFVNWEYVLKQLKAISIGDFYFFNKHKDGLSALQVLIDIYFSIISSDIGNKDIKDTALRYLFEYLHVIISNSRDNLPRNKPIFDVFFNSLRDITLKRVHLLKKSSGYLKTTVQLMTEYNIETEKPEIYSIFKDVFKSTYLFWLNQPDPTQWFSLDGETEESFTAYGETVFPLSHKHIQNLLLRLEDIDCLKQYFDMPDYLQIVNGYLLTADTLENLDIFQGRNHLIKLNFLLNVMNVEGLSDIHNSALIEINGCLGQVLKEENHQNTKDFIKNIFHLLKKTVSKNRYQNSIIDCITTLAKEVYAINNHILVETFIDELIAFGFQYPNIQSSTAEWRIQVNPNHIKNIRSWIQIIARKPRWSKKLLSALIINLNLKGVFVRDTDLLQKDISGLLNSDIQPAFNLVKQLLRLFPIYFTEIGAEGELREISTTVDELSARNDRLIYFLRKQAHVESNNLLVSFIEDIFQYWNSGDKTLLSIHLPVETYKEVTPSGEYYDGLHIIFNILFQKIQGNVQAFLEWDNEQISREIGKIYNVVEREKERARLMIRFYQLIHKKYFHQHIDLLKDLELSHMIEPDKINTLKRALKKNNYYRSLVVVLNIIAILKEKILSPDKTEYFENIYHKRHVAASIPSMYGTYREEKFEAMGFTLRLESFATFLFDKLTESLNLRFITKSTLMKIHKYLWLYIKALDLEGITTEGIVTKLRYITSALKIRQFSMDQYINIFQFISKSIQNITHDYFTDTHRANLSVIIGQIINDSNITEQKDSQNRELYYRYSENFIRSMISSTFGLQILDNFVNAIIRALNAEREKFKDNKQILNLVMAYIPELTISTFHKKNKNIDNQILIGNKGYFLKKLVSYNLPIPPGFIITTEVFRCLEGVMGYRHIFNDLNQRIYREIKELERITGKEFGNPDNPLLLSVRSGATISLPGMMRSFLNVGINKAVAEGLAKKNDFQWAAWDSYRRFLQTWGMFHGLERNFFDEIINNYKKRYGISKKIQFNPEQMKQIARSYKHAMKNQGVRIVDKPYVQLYNAIRDVFTSWQSEQAKIYRHQMNLSDEWGTAVIVQAMVFGNLHENSGSGVIFTRDPKGSPQDVAIYGDFIFGVQGDDIVSGLVETYPISEKQRTSEKRESTISLEIRFPEIYNELVSIAEFLVYEKGFNHQEIEFTFENNTKKGLYILQMRDMVQRETNKVKTFKDDKGKLEESLLGKGIGISGGALTGKVVYSEDEIAFFKKKEPDTPLILIRPDTVPDDVGILLQVDGILTARGGVTSHAAVTIPQLKKVGVVGFNKLHVYESEGYSTINSKTIKSGDFISIDGWSGAVYTGKHKIGEVDSFTIRF